MLGAVVGFLRSLIAPLSIAGLILVPLTMAGSFWWANQVTENHLSHIPRGFGVTKVLVAGEVSAGIGPGANENGLIVYALPRTIADLIEKEGISAVYQLAAGNRRHDFASWHQTPLVFNENWPSSLSPNGHIERARIIDFVRQHWSETDISSDLDASVTEMLQTEGNFYSFAGSKMLILSPSRGKAAFAYSG